MKARHRAVRFPPAPLLLLLLCLTACGRPAEPVVLSGATMGTTWEVKLRELPPGQTADLLQRAVSGVFADVDMAMSTWRGDSELSRINARPAGEWIKVSPALFEVLAAAQEISALSDGAFDVTVGPLVNVWGFGPAKTARRVPPEEDIQAARARVGYRNIELDREGQRLRKRIKGLYIDLSGIAKGYAADRVARMLEEAGARDFLVEVGGEIVARGSHRNGRGWRVGIERPEPGLRQPFRIVPLTNAALATSGDYRNAFYYEGDRYSHTIDPATGRPVTHSATAVTVIAPTAMRADALATALLVLGPERGLDLARREGIAALFIMRAKDGFEERHTENFPWPE